MSAVPVSTLPFSDVGELLERLGNVPPHRVRLQPPPGQATERDVLAWHDRENRLFELVDDTLVEKAMGFREAFLATWIAHLIQVFLDQNNLGIVTGADGMIRLLGKQVRIPDVSFFSWGRLPGRKIPRAPIPDLVPDLAVEVLSESNTAAEMERKLKEYFLAGVIVVWVVDPDRRAVEVYSSPDQSTLFTEAKTLTAEGVLPGLRLPVKAIFDRVPVEEAPAKPSPPKAKPRKRKKS